MVDIRKFKFKKSLFKIGDVVYLKSIYNYNTWAFVPNDSPMLLTKILPNDIITVVSYISYHSTMWGLTSSLFGIKIMELNFNINDVEKRTITINDRTKVNGLKQFKKP